MDLPVKYDHLTPLAFCGTVPEAASYEDAQAVILPIPLESTTFTAWAFTRCRKWSCRSTTWAT
jgi:hypothetical protein